MYIDIGEKFTLDKTSLEKFKSNEAETLHALANEARDKLKDITISASNPDFVRAAHLARNIYRENDAATTHAEYVTFTKRVIQMFENGKNDTKIQGLFERLKAFQTQLELLNINYATLMNTKILYYRALMTFLSIPLSLPGSLYHAPLGVISHYIGIKLAKGYTDQEAHFKIMPLLVLVPLVWSITSLFLWFFVGLKWTIFWMALLIASAYIAVQVQPLRFTYQFLTGILRLTLFNQDKMKEEQKQLYTLVREILDNEEGLTPVRSLMRPQSFAIKNKSISESMQ